MKIEIKNFGPIENLTFDLKKDLHLIFGENAIGKSYATYSLYCLIKNIKNKAISHRYFIITENESNRYSKFIKNKLKNSKTKTSIDCTLDFNRLIETDLKDIILKGLQNSLLNTFSSLKNLKNRFNKENYQITIHISDKEKLQIDSNDDGELDLKYIETLNNIEILIKNTKSTKYSLYKNGKKEFGVPNEEEFIYSFTRHTFLKTNEILYKLDFNIKDIYYLPASRSGLYQALNAFTPIIAELTQNRFFMQNKSIELPSLSEPLADYFIDLSTVDKKHINKEYDEIINSLQNEILKGEVEYDEKTKRILYKPREIDLELNLSEASSMVAELSPLVLYFKHILNNKYTSSKSRDPFFFDSYYSNIYKQNKDKGIDILFIEEPEAHLHPEVQVKLIEVFAKLSKLNLKIIITSHSNYMFNKINNLIIKKELNIKNVAVYHLIKEENGSTINGNMNISEEGINDENFQDVSAKLYFERLNFLENQK